MKIKIGILVVAIALLIVFLLLPGMLGRLIGLILSLLVWGSSGYLAGRVLQGERATVCWAISCWAWSAVSSARCW